MTLATTRVAVERGVVIDTFGDELDAWDTANVDPSQRPVVLSPEKGIAASLIERTRTVLDPSSGEPRTITTWTCRMPAVVDVKDGDRIRDLATGRIYAVDGAVAASRTIHGARALRFELKRTDGE